MDVNTVTIEGRLADDPVLAQTQGGADMLKLRLANNRGWGDNENTSFVNVRVYGKQVPFLKDRLTKGMKVIVENGELSITSGKDDNGEFWVYPFIKTFRVEMRSPSNGGAQQQAPAAKPESIPPNPYKSSSKPIIDEEIPF